MARLTLFGVINGLDSLKIDLKRHGTIKPHTVLVNIEVLNLWSTKLLHAKQRQSLSTAFSPSISRLEIEQNGYGVATEDTDAR